MSVAEIFETMAYGPAPEAPAHAQEWLAAHAPALGLFVYHRTVAPRDGV
jgi:aldehyde dehydrogenase (NAD+)